MSYEIAGRCRGKIGRVGMNYRVEIELFDEKTGGMW
jgi:hypothetical protein